MNLAPKRIIHVNQITELSQIKLGMILLEYKNGILVDTFVTVREPYKNHENHWCALLFSTVNNWIREEYLVDRAIVPYIDGKWVQGNYFCSTGEMMNINARIQIETKEGGSLTVYPPRLIPLSSELIEILRIA